MTYTENDFFSYFYILNQTQGSYYKSLFKKRLYKEKKKKIRFRSAILGGRGNETPLYKYLY